MFAIWYLPRFGNLCIQSAAKCTCTNFILQKSETFLCQSLGNHWKTFPNNGEKIVYSCQTTETIWPVTSFKLFIVHVHGYILVTIGSGFLFWNQNFCLQISTVCYFNKVRYLFGMNNQLTLLYILYNDFIVNIYIQLDWEQVLTTY